MDVKQPTMEDIKVELKEADRIETQEGVKEEKNKERAQEENKMDKNLQPIFQPGTQKDYYTKKWTSFIDVKFLKKEMESITSGTVVAETKEQKVYLYKVPIQNTTLIRDDSEVIFWSTIVFKPKSTVSSVKELESSSGSIGKEIKELKLLKHSKVFEILQNGEIIINSSNDYIICTQGKKLGFFYRQRCLHDTDKSEMTIKTLREHLKAYRCEYAYDMLQVRVCHFDKEAGNSFSWAYRADYCFGEFLYKYQEMWKNYKEQWRVVDNTTLDKYVYLITLHALKPWEDSKYKGCSFTDHKRVPWSFIEQQTLLIKDKVIEDNYRRYNNWSNDSAIEENKQTI